MGVLSYDWKRPQMLENRLVNLDNRFEGQISVPGLQGRPSGRHGRFRGPTAFFGWAPAPRPKCSDPAEIFTASVRVDLLKVGMASAGRAKNSLGFLLGRTVSEIDDKN